MKWFRLEEHVDFLRALTIIIGGRGIGKTYSAIDFVVNSEKKFIYMRNTAVQLKECTTAFGNPFKRWNLDHGRNIVIESEGMHSVILDYDELGETAKEIGYAVALSTFENLRGVDLSDVEYVLFDEFIERRTLTFAQFETFANFYETVNRNRELQGMPPLIVIMLSNAQKLSNPILAGYNLIGVIEDMMRNGHWYFKNKYLSILLPRSEVSEAKRQTANYMLTAGTKFADEALNNEFSYDSFAGIVKRNINEYRPLCAIDDIYIYRHKSNGMYYVCRIYAKNIQEFTVKDSKSHFLRAYGMMLRDNMSVGKVEYSDFTVKMQLEEIL